MKKEARLCVRRAASIWGEDKRPSDICQPAASLLLTEKRKTVIIEKTPGREASYEKDNARFWHKTRGDKNVSFS